MEPPDPGDHPDLSEPSGPPAEPVERWCPRCEWIGRSVDGPCPACRTPLLEVERPPPPAPAAAPGVASRSAASPQSPRAAAPVPGPREHPAEAPITVQTVGPKPQGAGARAARRRAAVVAALVSVVGFAVVANLLPGGPAARPGGPSAGGTPTLAPVAPETGGGPYPVDLPERLAFIVSSLSGGPGSQLYMADGRGSDRSAPA